MRYLAILIATALPFAAQAEQTLIRIEAKKSGASEAAAGWAAKFPDVVTFDAPGGWTAIALGPMERADAEKRLSELKAAHAIPADAFIAPASESVTPVPTTAQADTAPQADAASPVTTLPPATPGSTMPGAAAPAPATPTPAEAVTSGDTASEAAPEATPAAESAADTADAADAGTPNNSTDPADQAAALAAQAPPAPIAEVAPDAPATDAPPVTTAEAAGDAPSHYIRLQSLKTRDEGDAALAEWRKTFPAAALYQLPNQWFAVTLGPVTEEVGADWLKAFKTAKRAPKDAFVTSADKLGTEIIAGSAANLPAAGTAEMPPMDDVQRALRWGGYYAGAIDGKPGPKTNEAIANAVVGEHLAPDTATAMAKLIEKRAEWRASMGLSELRDTHTGLAVSAPMGKLSFDRTERALSIYGPKDDSGAALILFSQPGGQQDMLDLTGLVTALGWVPSPTRDITQGRAVLDGRNDTHIGHAEATVTDGRAQGFVLIWPVEDAANQPRVFAEIADSLTRFAKAETDPAEATPPTTGTEATPATAAPAAQ